MKNKFWIWIINISAIFLLLFAIEIIIWNQENQTLRKLGNLKITDNNIPFHAGIIPFKLDLNTFPETKEYEYGRQPDGLEYKNKPIVIFGCSYAYGHFLDKEQTLSYKMSHQAKVPVYNRAYSGWGIQHMLYQVKRELFYEKVPEPQYAIYVFIPDHINRLYFNFFVLFDTLLEKFNLRYKEKDGKLYEVTHNNKLLNQFQRLYLVNKINQHIIIKTQKTEKHYNFALKHFIESKEEMQKHWKNTKYVVLFYTTRPNDYILKNKLKENDFIVLDAEEITNTNLWDDKYMRKDIHPTEDAWNIIVPKLIENLGIQNEK